MKKLKVFMLAFVMVLCGTIFLSACDKEEDKKPEPPIVAVESIVNPIIAGSGYIVVDSILNDVTISTSVGDTPGIIRWETPTLRIVLGENDYNWVFTPEDTQRYKSATGTLTVTGIPNYDNLRVEIDDCVYGQTVSEPRIMNYTGSSENITVVYEYYDKDGNLLNGKPTEAGEYKVHAIVTIEGLNDPISCWTLPTKPFIISKAQVTDFDLTMEGWTYAKTHKLPEVKEELEDIVDFVYSDTINGTYTEEQPSNAGTYYVKAVIKDDNNYSGESAPAEFVIEKASYTDILKIDIAGWTYGEEAKTVSLTSIAEAIKVEELTSVTYLYSKKGENNFTETVPTNSGEYTLKVVVGVSADGNYAQTEFTKDFVIDKANFDSKAYPETITVDYSADLSLADIELVADWAWDTTDANYAVDLEVGENVRVAVYTDPEGNYNPIKVNLTINVEDNSGVKTLQELALAISEKAEYINITENIEINYDMTIDYETEIVIAEGKTLTLVTNATLTIVDGVVIGGEGSFVNNGNVVLNATNLSSMSSYVNKVVVQENVSNTDCEEVAVTNACEIDLNSKTLTNVTFVIKDNVVASKNIFIKNGTITNDGVGIIVAPTKSCNIYINNVKVNTTGYALYVNNSTAESENTLQINIETSNNCEFISTGAVACMLVDYSYATFNNTTISGKNGLYVKAGTINLNDCAITGNGDINDDPTEDLVPTGHAIYINIANHTDVYIYGGTLVTENNEEILILEKRLGESNYTITIYVKAIGVTESNIITNNTNVLLTVEEAEQE